VDPSSVIFDVVVVGGGPAGLSAALMLGRCRRRVLVCDLGQPRNRHSRALHAYLTRDGVAPEAFNSLGRDELVRYGIEQRKVGVDGVCWIDDAFQVALADGRHERSRFLLLASGVADTLPAVPGLSDCYGKSVFHCPYCDGWEFRDRRLAALGGGIEAVRLALGLKTWSSDVLLCSNGARIASSFRARLSRNGVAVRTEAVTRLDHDDGLVKTIVFGDGGTVPCEAVFFSSHQHPQSDIARRLGCAFTPHGTVKTGTVSETNVPRVFVAGDASRDAQFVVVAAAEGVKAAVAINRALQLQELAP
jgi:thioredoxin reductase